MQPPDAHKPIAPSRPPSSRGNAGGWSTSVRESRADYPSDVSDRQWRTVAAIVCRPRSRRRGRATPLREIVNGINYRWTTGCTWRMLPHDLPPWQTVYFWFRRWLRDGTLPLLREALLKRQQRREAA